MKNLLSVSQTSEILGVSEAQVRLLLRSNKLRGTMVGRQWVIDIDAINDFRSQKLHPEKVIDHALSCAPNQKLNALSFFTGGGGLDIGMSQAGITPRLMCECDKASRATLFTNNKNTALIGDIADFTPNAILNMAGLTEKDHIDVIFGGPPCQAFSTAGKRKGFGDKRGNVFLIYLDLITKLLPRYAVFENVRGILSAPYFPVDKKLNQLSDIQIKGGALLYIVRVLEKYGYTVTFDLYNAANFGAPQIRERLIIIAYHGSDKVPYLNPTHDELGRFSLKKWKTLKEALDTIPDDTEHHFVSFPEKRLKYYRMLKEGQNWRNLPLSLQKEALGKSYDLPGGKTGFFRRLSFDKPSPTLVTHPAMPATDLAHPVLDRPLSVEEYKAIQEFPASWEICGSLLDQYRQLGNAVPVPLGRAIGTTIMNHIQGIKSLPPDNFKFSRYKNTRDWIWIKQMEDKVSLRPQSLTLFD